MKVEIGYAFWSEAGGLTIDAELSFRKCASRAAAAMVLADGLTNAPALF